MLLLPLHATIGEFVGRVSAPWPAFLLSSGEICVVNEKKHQELDHSSGLVSGEPRERRRGKLSEWSKRSGRIMFPGQERKSTTLVFFARVPHAGALRKTYKATVRNKKPTRPSKLANTSGGCSGRVEGCNRMSALDTLMNIKLLQLLATS